MDHFRIIKRAFNITWAYRALWVFGILLALASGGGNGGGNGASSSGGSGRGGNFPPGRDFPDFPSGEISRFFEAWSGVIIAIICLIVLLIVLFTVLRYVANTALIRMVDTYEGSGEKFTVRQGFRLGWSRASFRTWLAALLLGLLGLVVVILSLLVAALPLLTWLAGNETLGIIASVVAVGLFFLAILVWIVFFTALSIVSELANRAIVLEGLGVMDGIRRGWALFRSRLGDNIVMGLILFGINLVITVLSIPLVFLLLLAAVVIAGVPGLLAGGITNIFVQGSTPQVVGLVVGGIILFLVLLIPLLFLRGLWMTFHSSTWTLTFRELLALGPSRPAVVPTQPAPAPVG